MERLLTLVQGMVTVNGFPSVPCRKGRKEGRKKGRKEGRKDGGKEGRK